MKSKKLKQFQHYSKYTALDKQGSIYKFLAKDKIDAKNYANIISKEYDVNIVGVTSEKNIKNFKN